MNDPLVLELIDIINEEIRLFNRLLQLLQEEQAAIVEGDLEGIEMNLIGQQEIAGETHLLEARRMQVVGQLSQRLDMDTENVSLSRLLQFMEREESEELGQMRERMLELNQKIRTATESNAFLIRQSMRYTERCLDIITGRPVGKGMYGRFGGTRRGTGSQSVLNQTA